MRQGYGNGSSCWFSNFFCAICFLANFRLSDIPPKRHNGEESSKRTKGDRAGCAIAQSSANCYHCNTQAHTALLLWASSVYIRLGTFESSRLKELERTRQSNSLFNRAFSVTIRLDTRCHDLMEYGKRYLLKLRFHE